MKRLFATDLDGTILPHKGVVHEQDLAALRAMGTKGIVRVVATGRSIYSAMEVMAEDFPIDYLVFSSGAGVYDWKKREMIRTLHLTRSQVSQIQGFFSARGLGYTIHRSIPANHLFWFHPVANTHPDLSRFLEFRNAYAMPLAALGDREEAFSQMLTMIDTAEEAEQIIGELEGVKAVRATSPLDGESIWIEVFHQAVSKASGIALVCDLEQVAHEQVYVLGNDYNDMDMLNSYHRHAFVVENAPMELKGRHSVVPAVDAAGMSWLAGKIF